MVKDSTPDRGDIISLEFHPQRGREQAGRRPALVLSPRAYNGKVGLAIVCPITHQTKGYPFEVALPRNLKTKGVILSDHVKSLDWRARGSRIIEKVPTTVLTEVLGKLELLFA
ncbi:endoribonuclease MazF [Candidatus Peregrinibacteria bacterium]|nr:endoribonuclease MazF [Candidatus Peregrinibacteria bacterium]